MNQPPRALKKDGQRASKRARRDALVIGSAFLLISALVATISAVGIYRGSIAPLRSTNLPLVTFVHEPASFVFWITAYLLSACLFGFLGIVQIRESLRSK